MWEKDKNMIYKYRQCIQAFMSEVKENSGGDIDWESACVEEGEKL